MITEDQYDELFADLQRLREDVDQARSERDEALAAQRDLEAALAEMTRERDALRARLDAAFDALTTVATVKPSTPAMP